MLVAACVDRIESGQSSAFAPGHGSDEVRVEPEAVRHREPGAQGRAQLDGLAAIEPGVLRFAQRYAAHFGRTRTSPAPPSTSTRAPSGMRRVASRQPTTPGMPYSRLTMAAWERSPPLSVTIAPIIGSTILKDSVVVAVTSTSP